MRKNIVAVYDQASKSFGQPIFTPALGIALRSFTDEVNNNHEGNQMYNHPSDFTLFDIGMYDDNSAEFHIHPTPIKLITAMDAKTPIAN
jgi:hypothetical protein